jgi:Leucine-rich repeat (LRR) protein
MNEIEYLPKLPDSLLDLTCVGNEIEILPILPNSLEFLDCSNNNLPFDDLDGYKKWYKENEHIINTEGLEYAYELSKQRNKYNL